MKIRAELPEVVARELLEDPSFIEPLKFRGSAAEVGDLAVTFLNVGATVVTLAQGPDVLKKIHRSMEKWRNREQRELKIEVTTGAESFSMTLEASDDFALDEIVRRLTDPETPE